MRVIVVGGSSGIGKAIVEECRSWGGNASHDVLTMQRRRVMQYDVELDLRWDQHAISEACREALGRLGGVDWLVLSGGVAAYTMPLVRQEQITEMIQTNYIGPRLVFNSFLRALHRQVDDGLLASRVLYIGSTAAQRTGKALEDYAASKAAAETYFLAAGRRYAEFGIRINVLAPGWVESPMSDSLKSELQDKARRVIALKRFARVEEVAEMAYHVLNGPDYLTGDRISIAGGL